MGILSIRLKEKNAHAIFGAIADELKKDGVELIEATHRGSRRSCRANRIFCSSAKLSAEQRADVEFGFRTAAKEVSRLEIGQLVIVKNGTVLAVEGFVGTDICLALGGELAGKDGGAVAQKCGSPSRDHDMRFDIPCIGLQTLETCRASGVAVLALESGKTLLLEREACETLVKKNRLSLTTI